MHEWVWNIFALFTEIHWLLLNIVISVIETFIVSVHQRLYACVVWDYRQRLESWSHCRLNLTVVVETFSCSCCAVVSEISGENDHRVSQNCEAPVLQNCLQHTFYQLWRHQGRDGRPIQFSLCTLIQTSVSYPHPRMTILESRSWLDTISVQPFSPNAVQ